MTFQKIYDIVKNIPRGKIMTYKQISILANAATPRIVGFALHGNKDPQHIPCHRVIFSNGKLSPGYAFGGEEIQRKKLKKEGVEFKSNGRINLEISQYDP